MFHVTKTPSFFFCMYLVTAVDKTSQIICLRPNGQMHRGVPYGLFLKSGPYDSLAAIASSSPCRCGEGAWIPVSCDSHYVSASG